MKNARKRTAAELRQDYSEVDIKGIDGGDALTAAGKAQSVGGGGRHPHRCTDDGGHRRFGFCPARTEFDHSWPTLESQALAAARRQPGFGDVTYFGYKLGALQYRSVRFETETLDTDNYQGNAVVNYTDAETPYTRIIEHKHFEFGTQPKTVISREYSAEWKPGDEPYYPVNDEKNGALYAEYKKLADAEPKVIFGGRLGEYTYYDMDQVIAAVLDRCESELH